MSQYKAIVDGVRAGNLVGWACTEDNQQISAPVTIFIDGKPVTTRKIHDYRRDLEEAGLADGYCAFSIALSAALFDGNQHEVKGELEGQPVFVWRGRLRAGKTNFIANPSLSNQTTRDIPNWRIPTASRRLAYRVESRKLTTPLTNKAIPTTRLIYLEAPGADFELVQQLVVPENDGLVLQILARAPVSRELRLRIKDATNPSMVHLDEQLSLDGTWVNPSWPVSASAHLILELTVFGGAPGFVDIVGLALTDANGSAGIEHLVPQPQGLATGNVEYTFNEAFERWSRGIQFKQAARGSETADDCFVDYARHTQAPQVRLISAPQIGSWGLELIRKTPKSGYLRLSTPIESSVLGHQPLNVHLVAKSLASHNQTQHLRCIGVIARSASSSVFATYLAKDVLIAARPTTLNFQFSLGEQAKVAAFLTDRPRLELFLEFDQANVEIELHRVALQPEQDDASLSCSTRSRLEFEDPLVGDQLLPTTEVSSDGFFSNSEIDQVIDIVVPVFNALDDVEICIESIHQHTTQPYRIHLINDASDQHEAIDRLTALARHPRVFVTHNPRNLGYTASVNIGLRASTSAWIVVLNSDTVVTTHWLPGLLAAALQDDNIGMVGPLSNAASYQSVPEVFDGKDWNLNPLPLEQVPVFADEVRRQAEPSYPKCQVLNGFCQVLSREMINEIGLLDETTFPRGYGEENDLCARAVQAGYDLVIADNVYVYHQKSKSFGHAQRKRLARAGSKALKKKHPSVNWGQITSALESDPILVRLRRDLAPIYQELSK